jgi:peptidoglycan/LPS O-acetylase OafA/YrhL
MHRTPDLYEGPAGSLASLPPAKSLFADAANYLAFVDGLRAVAILSVVAYHAGFRFVGGGFVGVDIFFVISGYLIIGQIVKGLQSDTFSFAEFWSRRALRILPPYLLVIATSCVVALFVLVTPEEIASFGKEVLWSAGMAANHLFLSQEGYFDRAAEVKPLLHLWSLAVEEQFYLVAPVALVLGFQFLARFSGAVRRWVAALTVGTLGLVSFWLCASLSSGDVNYAFYLMPLRAWEFIAGGLVPVVALSLRRAPKGLIEFAALLGVALMTYAILGFQANRPFPSTVAAIPVWGLGCCATPLHRSSVLCLVSLALAGHRLHYDLCVWQAIHARTRRRRSRLVHPRCGHASRHRASHLSTSRGMVAPQLAAGHSRYRELHSRGAGGSCRHLLPGPRRRIHGG